MSISGQFRPVAPPPFTDAQPVGDLLAQGLELVEDLTHKLQKLDSLMLAGKPNEISEAAAS
ncbi:MAG: hypothetical protein KGJ73_03455, partial [Rhodospirillales bacterium]|nr:hypothetical protein [Rhodospirillales bacterium]